MPKTIILDRAKAAADEYARDMGGVKAPSEETLQHMNRRAADLYALPASFWGSDGCPIGYMMTLERVS